MIKRPSLNGSRLQSVRWRKQTIGGYFKLWQDLLIFAELCEYFENCANIGRSIQRPQPNIATAWFCKIQHRFSSRCMEGTIWIIMNLILWNSTLTILIDLNMILQNILCSLNLLKSCVTKSAEFSYSDSHKSSLFQVCKNLVYSGFQKSCTSILIL